MSGNRYTPEQIIGKLREAEVALAQGETAGKVCRARGIAEQTFYRWRREYGGLKVEQAKRLKALEQENTWLTRAVADPKIALPYNGSCSILACSSGSCKSGWRASNSILHVPQPLTLFPLGSRGTPKVISRRFRLKDLEVLTIYPKLVY